MDTRSAKSAGIRPVTKLRYAAFIYVNTPRNRYFGYLPLIFLAGGFGAFFVVQCLFFRVILSFLRAFLTASPLHAIKVLPDLAQKCVGILVII